MQPPIEVNDGILDSLYGFGMRRHYPDSHLDPTIQDHERTPFVAGTHHLTLHLQWAAVQGWKVFWPVACHLGLKNAGAIQLDARISTNIDA